MNYKSEEWRRLIPGPALGLNTEEQKSQKQAQYLQSGKITRNINRANAGTYRFNIGGYENVVEIGGDKMKQFGVPASLKREKTLSKEYFIYQSMSNLKGRLLKLKDCSAEVLHDAGNRSDPQETGTNTALSRPQISSIHLQ